jgi:DNA-binding HxlR family transcriptional regulator
MLGKDYAAQNCSLARALEVVGERWTLLVVRDALFGVRRFSDFAIHLDIPRAVLADRLRGLVDAGLMQREPDPEHGGREVYELTPAGRDLWPAVHALMQWGSRFSTMPGPGRRFLHAACDTALDQRSACPRCSMTPAADDVVTVGPRDGPLREDPVSSALQAPRRLLQPLVLADRTTPRPVGPR